ncbi:hypothetical protein [Brachyspira hyodysenteriae]|nr:hypothetical protein [Brachyspira hyodysenteriae]MCZ9886384.1 hypothetical protein [Brachyspira hyodysenteriae]MCZ9938828.1 hypothetical protein [Brachyspira hyodysenteriae]MCZ9961370.1 hypothetical protein [Brachyspira hyodysenteriae]MDA0054458.1 hypothetical protein [Brachyspira hyodysenteriae]
MIGSEVNSSSFVSSIDSDISSAFISVSSINSEDSSLFSDSSASALDK